MAAELLEECGRHPLANFQEGYVKTFLAKQALDLGHSLLESSTTIGSYTRLSLADGKLLTTIVPRDSFGMGRPTGYGKSADLRIMAPAEMAVEIKVRSTAGSVKTVSTATLLKDVTRLKEGAVDALLLAADGQLYDSLRGDRTEKRGRKASAPELFHALLPPRSELKNGFLGIEPSRAVDGCIADAGRIVGAHGIERVVVTVFRLQKSLQVA